MFSRRFILKGASLALVGGLAGCAIGDAAPGSPEARADDAAFDVSVKEMLARLTQTQPAAAKLAKSARGILVFPEIIKGGIVVGASGGKGLLRIGGRKAGYYQSTAVSYGLQAGITTFGYVMFLMDNASVDYVKDTAGWEVGVGPVVTVADEGIAKRLTTTTAQEGIYVFFVDQKGFYAGAGIEGTKITRI